MEEGNRASWWDTLSELRVKNNNVHWTGGENGNKGIWEIGMRSIWKEPELKLEGIDVEIIGESLQMPWIDQTGDGSKDWKLIWESPV